MTFVPDYADEELADLIRDAVKWRKLLVCVAPNTNADVGGICGLSIANHPDTSGWPDDRHQPVPGLVLSVLKGNQ